MLTLGVFVAGVACGPADPPDAGPSREPDPYQRIGAEGLYRITLRPEEEPPPLGRLHSWIVTVESVDGTAIDPSQLTFDGGMPSHGHGLPTRPKVTEQLSPGRFRVEGVKFHMPGAWELRVATVGPAGGDTARFDVEIR